MPLATLLSQIYRIMGRTVVTYPKLLDETDFYMALDMSLLIDDIKVKTAPKKSGKILGLLTSNVKVWQSVPFL